MKFSEIKSVLAGKKVGIAGLGGLGSNCAVALCRSGVGSMVLVDFDIVDVSNLNRQYYFHDQIGMRKTEALKVNLQRISADISLEMHCLNLDEHSVKNLFRDCDLIVEAFDSADAKMMILETVSEFFPEKALVMGSGMAGWGGLDKIHRQKSGLLYVCGDQETDVSEDNPPLAPKVGIVSMMQADTVLEILLEN